MTSKIVCIVAAACVVSCKGADSTPASAGAKGERGVQLVWRGQWNASTAYVMNDAVQSQGAAYIAVAPSTNSAPPSAPWQVLVERAPAAAQASGPTSRGPQGPPGPEGPVGPQGPAGPAGSGGASDAQMTSGARLTAMRTAFTGADGSRLAQDVHRFFDSAIGAFCAPRKASDGELRCLPGQPDTADVSPEFFADEACTKRVALYSYASESGCSPTYAVEPLSAYQCSGGQFRAAALRVYQIGAALPPTTTFFTNSGGGCSKITLAPYDAYYAVGAELPPAKFVRFTAEPEKPATAEARADAR